MRDRKEEGSKWNREFVVFRTAFTLAEVLISLGIIGVVAALTMPSLIQQNNEKSIVVSLKKTYSALQQAYVALYSDHGTPENWEIDDATGFRDLMGEQLKLVEKCDPMKEGCWYNKFTKTISGANSENIVSLDYYSTAVLADGSILAFDNFDATCNLFTTDNAACGQIIVDVNGFKKPNQWGKDVFAFLITKNRVIPRGWPEGDGVGSFEEYCSNVGHACAGWVIINENLDYLRCPEQLNWNEHTKCY